jgi:hypothetical protein
LSVAAAGLASALPPARFAFDLRGVGQIEQNAVWRFPVCDARTALGALRQGRRALAAIDVMTRQQLHRIVPRLQAYRARDVIESLSRYGRECGHFLLLPFYVYIRNVPLVAHPWHSTSKVEFPRFTYSFRSTPE